MSKIKEVQLSKNEHDQLGLCPWCYGMGKPYLVRLVSRYLGEKLEIENFYQAVCGECEARGPVCGEVETAVKLWNDISLSRFPDQTTRWPNSPLVNVRGNSTLWNDDELYAFVKQKIEPQLSPILHQALVAIVNDYRLYLKNLRERLEKSGEE